MKPNKKAPKPQGEQVSDDRFKEVYNDPRFMSMPKKLKKVKIDDRFKKALTSKEFNLLQKVDKYGKRVDKQDNTIKNFYQLEDESSKFYDDEGKFKWEQLSSSSDSEDIEDIKPSKVESEGEVWSSEEEDQMGPKKVKEEELQVGKRLALTNMDWDNLNAVDLLAIFSSLCKGEQFVHKVEILPSLYGLEQMKKDTLYGPPKELFDAEPKKIKKKSKKGDNLSDEGEVFDQEELRRYEINKMKYFYAVIYCNTVETARKLYDEYNDYEFELSNIRLNLSFIADDLVFPQDAKETATELPPGYEFKAANSLTRALNHTQVKLTWDETDPKRLRKFQKLMEQNPDHIDEDEYREFLASGTEDEASNEESRDQAQIENYRKLLLGSLSGETTDNPKKDRDLQVSHADDEEALDIKFNAGFGEDIGKEIIKKKKKEREERGDSAWEAYQRKRKEKKKEKKEKQKKQKQRKHEEEVDETKAAELELLVAQKHQGAKDKSSIQANVEDSRFKAVFKDKEYAIDPTSKNFRKMADGAFVNETKKRHKHN